MKRIPLIPSLQVHFRHERLTPIELLGHILSVDSFPLASIMCGIIGIAYAEKDAAVAQALVDGLTILQHRGQDASGIVTSANGRMHLIKNGGRVADVFTQENIVHAVGNIGIGHVRYPTAGMGKRCEAQPMYTNYPFGIGIAHNGNLTNTHQLIESLEEVNRHINTESDSEVLLNIFAEELSHRPAGLTEPDILFDAVGQVMFKCTGAYAVVLLINGVGLLAFRDPHGIRPLCFGSRETAHGTDYAVASESVAIDALDPHFHFRLQRDLRPGEAVLISTSGELTSRVVVPEATLSPCLFEYVYFARPDSILDGVHVHEARGLMGERLAHRILADVLREDPHQPHGIDAVIPVPETSRTAALRCAHILNIPYREGLVKNRYIARTFIMPGQAVRRRTVRLKLNCIKAEFAGKTVLLVDDSIVRGTTAVELVQMARDAGAKKVYFASAAPPVRHPNVYGIDIPTRRELVAHDRSLEEVQLYLQADRLFYNTLADTEDAVRSLNPTAALSTFDSSCFSGRYVTPEVTEEYLRRVMATRGADSGATGADGRYPAAGVDRSVDGTYSTAEQEEPELWAGHGSALRVGGGHCESIFNAANH